MENLCVTNSFGESKSYNQNGQLQEICNYVNGIDDKIIMKTLKII